MAKALKDKSLPARHNYPWDEWFDGRVWELVPGVDFTSRTSLRARAHGAATQRGKKVSIRNMSEVVLLQARDA